MAIPQADKDWLWSLKKNSKLCCIWQSLHFVSATEIFLNSATVKPLIFHRLGQALRPFSQLSLPVKYYMPYFLYKNRIPRVRSVSVHGTQMRKIYVHHFAAYFVVSSLVLLLCLQQLSIRRTVHPCMEHRSTKHTICHHKYVGR